MSPAKCPDRDQLRDYLVGRLPDDTSESLASHLETCLECQAGLATLADTDDTLVGQLRGPVAADPFLDEPECGLAIARAKAATGGQPPFAAERPEGCLAQMGTVPLPPAEPTETSLPTQLGEYQLIERLGSGSMGAVYKARHNRLDRVVALKVLPRGRTDDTRAVVRFEREMKAIGRLDHPHIVRAYDAREIDDRLVLVMEFVEGLDLRKISRRLGRLGTADACELARQAALGLQAAHEHGLVHRDIKPSNLILTPGGQVKVLDLGLARFHSGLSPLPPGEGQGEGLGASVGAAVKSDKPVGVALKLPPQRPAATDEDLTGTGQAMGTADYMAPEQTSDSRAVDIRADIYGLGATLYKLLSGRAPFSGPEHQGTLEKMLAHRQEPIPPIREFCPAIPAGLAAVLDRMLAKSPEDRYSTPAEAAEALAAWCEGADLPALLKRALEAKDSPPLPPGEGSHRSPRPLGEGQGEGQPLAASHGWKRIAAMLVGLLLFGGFCFALGIVIRVQKDGHAYEVEAPDGSRTTIDEHGNVTVAIAPKPEGATTPVLNAAADLKALEGAWQVVRVEQGNNTGAAAPMADLGVTVAKLDRLSFSGGVLEYFSLQDGYAKSVFYRIDPAASPKTIDLLPMEFDKEHGYKPGEMFTLGRYEVKGNQLAMRLARFLPAVKGDQRPESIYGKSASSDVLLLLERYQPSEDEKAIQGDYWAVASQIEDGKPVAQEKLRNTGVRFRDCGFVILDSSNPDVAVYDKISSLYHGRFTLYPTSQPKAITLFNERMLTRPDAAGVINGYDVVREKLLGIYKFDGDRLTIAFHKGDTPPKKFESLPNSGVTLLVLEKAKAAEPAGGMGGKTPAVNALSDLKALEGSWRVVRSEIGKAADVAWWGESGTMNPEKADAVQFFSDTEASRYMNIIESREGRETQFLPSIDPTKTPKTIDLRVANEKGRLAALGIYQFDGERLSICLAGRPAGLETIPRPQRFAVDPDSGDVLFVLERYRPSEEEKAIAGDWSVAKRVENGTDLVATMHRKWSCSIGDGSFSIQEEGVFNPERWVLAFYAIARPNLITMYTRDYPANPPGSVFYPKNVPAGVKKKLVGIYKLDGDRLSIAYSTGGPRPEKFESLPGSGVTLLVLEKAKAAEPAVATGGVTGGPAAEKPTEHPLQFGPVTELVVNAVSEGKGGEGLDLAAGKLIDVPKEFSQWSAEQNKKWSTENNVDLVVDLVTSRDVGTPDDKSLALVPEGLKLQALWGGMWELMPIGEKLLRLLLTSPTPERPELSPEGSSGIGISLHERHGITYFVPFNSGPHTFAFQTRKGDLGLLQIVRFTEDPRGMRIRYKLARSVTIGHPGGYGYLGGYPSISERAATVGGDWAKGMFKVTSHDFGTVARGAKAEYRFIVANGFAEDVHIKSVSSSSCVQARITDTLVKSSHAAEIVATMDTEKFVGRRSGHIKVDIDSPVPAQVVLEVTGYVGDETSAPSRAIEAKPPAAPPVATFRTATVTRGDMTETIRATGTIEPEELVDVGTQVTGQIVKFGDDPRGKTDPNYKGKTIDYLSPVEEGTVLAQIDDTLYKTRRDQEKAGYERAKAELEAAKFKATRAHALGTDVPIADAAVTAAEAGVAQSEAALHQAQTDLDRTIIKSPIKGMIIDRRVNLGQNVGPTSNTLFLIAKDVEKLQVWAAVNEADIARIKTGMDVHFTVDAYPKETFKGKVSQIRLNAQMTQAIVTYTVVVTGFENPKLKLLPYLTANLQFEVATHQGVLRVPNGALRWMPKPSLMVPGQPDPAEATTDRRARGRLWVKDKDEQHVRRIEAERGWTDGTLTEVSGPDVKEGMEVVVGELPQGQQPDNTSAPFTPKLFKGTSATPSTEPGSTQSPDQGKSAAKPAKKPAPSTVGQSSAVNPVVDLKALQGQWTVVRSEIGKAADVAWRGRWGTINPAEVDTINFSDQYVGIAELREGRGVSFLSSINPTNTPKTIDLRSQGKEGKLAALGIYQFEGERLTICLAGNPPGLETSPQRPERFAVDPDSGDALFVLERYRPSEEEKTIEGDWTVVARVDNGKDTIFTRADGGHDTIVTRTENGRDSIPLHWQCTLGGHSIYLRQTGPQARPDMKKMEIIMGRYAIAPPNRITIYTRDYSGQVADGVKKELAGIYKREGDRLTIAYREGGPRPEKFESQPGSSVTLLVMEKPKAADSPAADAKSTASQSADREKSAAPPVKKAAPAAPPVVTVARPIVREVTDYEDFVGRIEAAQTVKLRARATGNLVKIDFTAGALVKQGELLFEIDPQPYQVELEKRTVEKQYADRRLEVIERRLERAKQANTAHPNTVSQTELDQIEGERAEGQAAVKAAQAAMELAKLNLDSTKVTAPISGRISRPALDVGNLVTANSTVLATLVSVDPMCVSFAVDERSVLRLRKVAESKDNSAGRSPLRVECGLADEEGYSHHATLESMDTQLDPATGTALWRATLPNPDGILMPGMYVRVRLITSDPHKALLIPEQALGSNQDQKYVLVVTDKNIVDRRTVKIGQAEGELRVVQEGISADDWVVISGLNALRPGMTVKPKKTDEPPAKSATEAPKAAIEPRLRSQSGEPAAEELVTKVSAANRDWLRPHPPAFRYNFAMEHPGTGDRYTANVDYTDPSHVQIERDDHLLHKSSVDDSYDPTNSAYSPRLITLQQAVTLFGPLQEWAMFPDSCALRMIGEETLDGEAVILLQVKRAERPGAAFSKPWEDRLRKSATRPTYLYEFTPIERKGADGTKVEIELKCVYGEGPGWPAIVAAQKASPAEIRWGGKLITAAVRSYQGQERPVIVLGADADFHEQSPVTKVIFNSGIGNMTPKLGLGEGPQIFDEHLFEELKSTTVAPGLPMRVGCGIWGSWYGYSGGGADVDQVWAEKSSGVVLREEGFYKGKGRFVVQYGDFGKFADGGAVPRRVVVTLLGEGELYPWVFDMEFSIVDGKVWLLKRLTESQGDRKGVATGEVSEAKLRDAGQKEPANADRKHEESSAE